MSYDEACKILGVSKNDSLEKIRATFREILELSVMNTPNDEEIEEHKKMFKEITDAFDTIYANYDKDKRESKINKKYIREDEFISKYKDDSFILYYAKKAGIGFHFLYENYYKKYYERCLNNNQTPMSIHAWIVNYSKVKSYCKNGLDGYLSSNIDELYNDYIESLSSTPTTSFVSFVIRLIMTDINSDERYKFSEKTLEKYINEYIKNNSGISFIEFLNGKVLNYSPENVRKNISKIIDSNFDFRFNNITNEELFEILKAITGDANIETNPKYKNKLRSKDTAAIILAHISKNDKDVITLAEMIGSNIDILANAYMYLRSDTDMSFKDYLSLVACVKALNKADDHNTVLGLINNNNKRVKVILKKNESLITQGLIDDI